MKSVSIATFITAIESLPADRPKKSTVWYLTQKEHWLGWLGEYNGPGAYGRDTSKRRDARYASNHIVNWQMLEWLIRAAGADAATVKAVHVASEHGTRLQEKAAATRRVVPWEAIAQMLWGERPPSSGRLSRGRGRNGAL
jgi:hypothetical protein